VFYPCGGLSTGSCWPALLARLDAPSLVTSLA